METLSNLASTIRDRTRSPFYGAFILAWLVVNWRIMFAIFFFGKEDLAGVNLVEFVEGNYVSLEKCLLWPLFYSVVIYILILPWVDYLAMWYTELVRQEKMKRKLRVQEKYMVDGKTHVELLTKFEKQNQRVIEFEAKTKEAETKAKEAFGEVNSLESSILEFERKNTELNSMNGLYQRRHSFNDKFSGRWTLKYPDKENGGASEQIEIQQSSILRFVDKPVQEGQWNVEYIDMDFTIQRLVFVIRNKKSQVRFYDLRMVSDSRFEGYENRDIEVTFIRDTVTVEETIKNK